MTQVLTHGLTELLPTPARSISRTSEDALRVAAMTLARACAGEVTAATVVVEIGPDDLAALQHVARLIAEECELDLTMRPRVGCCSVRFARGGRAAG